MKKVEELLQKEQQQPKQMEVPEELEARLGKALEKASLKKRKIGKKGIAIAACLLILAGFQFDTLAYYSKRLAGYEQIMDGTLKQLNELGKGQTIGKSYAFESGLTVTLDGIMLDANQLLMFYTLELTEEAADWDDFILNMTLKGMVGRYIVNRGIGELQGEREQKWMVSFDAPLFFERSFELELVYQAAGSIRETGQIEFAIEPETAMGSVLRQRLNHRVKAGDTTLTFTSITASPTQTVVTGKVKSLFQVAEGVWSGEREKPQQVLFSLVANGEEMTLGGMGMRTDMEGVTFEGRFDALPESLESLEINVMGYTADRPVKGEVALAVGSAEKYVIDGQEIGIQEVRVSEGQTLVTLTTEEHVRLSSVFLLVGEEKVSLEKTLEGELQKEATGKISYTRTLVFPVVGEQMTLLIERILATVPLEEQISILKP